MSPGSSIHIRRTLAVIIVSAFFLGLFGCASPKTRYPAPTGKSYPRSGKSYVIKGKRYHIMASAKGYREKGEASWYGKKFHGRKTASGEVYDMHDLTAAHKTLPLQTWVKVTNLVNGRDVTVRVNDRGPFAKSRIIDLSYAAARQLSMVGAGKAPVVVEALGRPEKRKVNGKMQTVLVQPKNYNEGRFSVQVASLQNKQNARNLAEKLGRKYGGAVVVTFDRGDAVFYRVQVSEKRTLGQAMDLQAQLEKEGFRDCFVVAR